MDKLIQRILIRLDGENPSTVLLTELLETAIDRIKLLLNEKELPTVFESIAVDVVVKMYRRKYYEGIKTEGAEGVNTTFNNILDEYKEEFDYYKANKNKAINADRKKVRFI